MTAKLTLNEDALEWLRRNEACRGGYKWASQNCATLAEVVETARPDWSVWTMTRPGVLTDRELWLFACWCAEQVLPAWRAFAPDDHRPQQAIEARRGWLDGSVSDGALAVARSAAWSVAWSSARSAAEAVAWSAAEAAEAAAWSAEPAEAAAEAAEAAAWSAWSAEPAEASAWSAARSAARSSAASSAWSSARSSAASSAWSSAARSAWSSAARSSAWSAWSAARSSAWSSAWSAQRDWLLANTAPTFADGSRIGGAE